MPDCCFDKNPRRALLRRLRVLPALLALALALPVAAEPGLTPGLGGSALPEMGAAQFPRVTRVVVRKADRKLELLSGAEVVRSYRVSLGLVPEGHKERAGDFRTPEGRYYLTRRNARSDFFLSIQVSYPNDRDARNAKRNGWDPGGSIMIHGLPNKSRREPDYYGRDWTDGCIAVSNSDMVEIWLLTNSNTPIDILP